VSAARTIQIPVRELVEFACRTGNLGGAGKFVSAKRALEGTRGHQQIQKARPEGYESEVAIVRTWTFPGFQLELSGRIDGVMRAENPPWIEEIKTVVGAWDGVPDPLHWAQGKTYAAMLADELPGETIEVRLTYLELDSGQVTTFRETFPVAALRTFLQEAIQQQADWLADHLQWIGQRDESIRATEFPHRGYRPGQRELAVAVYRAATRGGRLFSEAPTGIGKTISVLFPALKAICEGHADQVLFVTAKTSGRASAEQSVSDLRAAGMKLRALTLTARDKICFGETQPCDVATCPFALGFYDRLKPALKHLLHQESLSRATVEAVAREHSVCPFALSMQAVRWCDVVIGDFNHAFDPSVRLEQFGEESPVRALVLVDEAHNLVDRARKIFSASLEGSALTTVQRDVRTSVPALARALGKLSDGAKQLAQVGERHAALPAEFTEKLRTFLQRAEQWLARNEPAPGREALLALYFEARWFEVVAGDLSDAYAITTGQGETSDGWRVDLRCVDPSPALRAMMAGFRATVFFSATLSPVEYFQRVLGGESSDAVVRLASPFPPEHLRVLVETSVRTDFKGRENSLGAVADSIRALVAARAGNYLVFFPSYRYLESVAAQLEPMASAGWRLRAQRSDMTDAEREEFLRSFHEERGQTLIGLAVMGGAFGEGIDLVGDKLIGVVVVGVGLPQIGLERDLIRERFDAAGEAGFDFAYRFPGLNRVVQAAGRLIRSESDRGVVLLLDARWRDPAYARLLPEHWSVETVNGPVEISRAAAEFWERWPAAQLPE
jgi:DNA excision repair protein ERCC-2